MIIAVLFSLTSEADACGMPHDYEMSLAALMEEVEAEPILIVEEQPEPKTPAEAFEQLAPPVDKLEEQPPPAPSRPLS